MSDPSVSRHVWIISEGSPGHVSQTRGLLDALGRLLPVHSTTIETRPRINGLGRLLLRHWMGPRGRPLSKAFLAGRLGCRDLPHERPELVVASGGKAVFAARTLAAMHAVPLAFIGERKPYPAEWFHTVFTPSPLERGTNDVGIEVIPTPVTPALAAAEAAAWTTIPSGRLWSMIIGGGSASHIYQKQDWVDLATAMNSLAERHGIRWLLTTSRRTGVVAEAVLECHLDPDHLAAAVWWAKAPARCLLRFLGACERVFVTQDSVTMVTEAVESAKPVVALSPRETRLHPGGFLERYYERLESSGRIARVPIGKLTGIDPATFDHRPRTRPAADEIAETLVARLGWMPVRGNGIPLPCP
jgi:hypothetical protein